MRLSHAVASAAHSDHHAFPKRRYPMMFVLAPCPPLWRRVIDHRVPLAD